MIQDNKSVLTTKLDDLSTKMLNKQHNLDFVVERVTEVERRVSSEEDTVDSHATYIRTLLAQVDQANDKLENMEDRS